MLCDQKLDYGDEHQSLKVNRNQGGRFLGVVNERLSVFIYIINGNRFLRLHAPTGKEVGGCGRVSTELMVIISHRATYTAH